MSRVFRDYHFIHGNDNLLFHFLFQVELLELISCLNFKVISFLEATSPDIVRGDHNFLGVSSYFILSFFLVKKKIIYISLG